MLHLSNKRKEKEILNNNLAVLPSHDINRQTDRESKPEAKTIFEGFY